MLEEVHVIVQRFHEQNEHVWVRAHALLAQSHAFLQTLLHFPTRLPALVPEKVRTDINRLHLMSELLQGCFGFLSNKICKMKF